MGPLRLDHTTACLISALYGAVRVIPAEPIPALRKGDARDLAPYLSPGTRKTLRKATNRLHTDHRKVEYEFTNDPDIITALSPQLVDARRARDHHHAIGSALNTSDGRHRWRKRLQALEQGAVELGLLRIDQELAAYILGGVDGRTYRVLEGCYLTQWRRYAPGRLIESAAVQRFLHNPELITFDWMTYTAVESLIAVNHREPAVILYIGHDDPAG